MYEAIGVQSYVHAGVRHGNAFDQQLHDSALLCREYLRPNLLELRQRHRNFGLIDVGIVGFGTLRDLNGQIRGANDIL